MAGGPSVHVIAESAIIDEFGLANLNPPHQTSLVTVAGSAAHRHSAPSTGNHSGTKVIADGTPLISRVPLAMHA